jgi:FKBP-type peptidyl-prolyl cis-trans isomerase
MANKQTAQRVTIWVIAIVMTVGTLGAYFLIILQNNDASKQQSQTAQQQPEKQLPVDPTAYKVEGKVNELQKTDLVAGTGDELKVGDKIRVHYKGTLATTGQKFDSSYDRGEPADLTLDENNLIKGWVEGLPGMKVGGKRRLVIPASLGYGAQASGNGIPANSDLVFEVELLAINPKQ